MNKIILFLSIISISLLTACGNATTDTAKTNGADSTIQYFGDTISPEGAIAVDQLATQMQGKDSLKIKLTGTIVEVCQKKGCWMTMNIGGDRSMRISFKDYGFFVPKDASGKTVIMEGVAFNDTTQIADLRHFAEDAGKTKEEIAKIMEPEINLGFEANGVIIKK